MTRKWYAMPPEAVEEAMKSGAAGLSEKEVSSRRRSEGENNVFALPRTSALTCAAYICSDLSVLLLALTAILSAIWGEDGVSVLLLVAINCGAAILTYLKARRIIESMAVCTMPRVRVLRGGRVFAIDARQLVRGDVILLEAGDVVPCDARLTSADGLDVLEYRGKIEGRAERGRVTKDASRLYGEHEVLSMGEQLNMVFAGSVILGGQGRAIVVETGADTLLVATEGPIPPANAQDRMPALEALKRHCARSSLVMLVMILPLTLIGILLPSGGMNLLDCFLLSLSLAVSSMSELTAAIGCIVVGSGLLRAAKGGEGGGDAAILPRMRDLPVIARTDTVVLFDDTALTEGRIGVVGACCGTAQVPLDAHLAQMTELIETALIAAGLPDANALSAGGAVSAEIPALLALAEAHGCDAETLRAKTRMLGYAPATAANPLDTALIEEQRAPYVICRGELKQILARCRRTADPAGIGGTCLLRGDRRDALLNACAAETAQGGYAVAYARRSSPYTTLHRLSAVQEELILIGVLIFRDPIAEGVPAAVDALADAGVHTVLMLDCPRGGGRAEDLARGAGILRRGVICRAPDPITPDAELCIGYSPAEQRAWLAERKAEGHLTLGLGSAVKDLSLLQACAVGAVCTPVSYSTRREDRMLTSLDPANGEVYGAELLKKSAGLLIRRPVGAQGGVSALAAARRIARRIEANLASALRCLLAAQSMRTVMLFLLLFLQIPDLKPMQILFSGLILDFGAILLCAFDRGRDIDTPKEIFAHPLRSCLPDVLIGAVCGAGAVLAAYFLRASGTFAADAPAQSSSFLFLALLLTQLTLLFVCRRGTSLFRGSRIGLLWPMAVAAFGAACYFLPAVGDVFGVCALPLSALLCLLIPPMIAAFGGEIIRTVRALRTEDRP